MILQTYTVSALPSASSQQGSVLYVTDSDRNGAIASGSIAVGGGSFNARVLSDGTNWRLHGALSQPVGGAVNLITSQDLTSAFWTKENTTITSTDQVIENTANSSHTVKSAIITRTDIARFTGTVDLLKIGSRNFVLFGLFSGDIGAGGYAYFNLNAGTIDGTGSYGGFTLNSQSIQSLGVDGYRCQVVVTTDAITTGLVFYPQAASAVGTTSYIGDGSSGFRARNMTLYAS
jgi:hypothetical protein